MQVSETLLALQKLQTYNLIFSGPPVAFFLARPEMNSLVCATNSPFN